MAALRRNNNLEFFNLKSSKKQFRRKDTKMKNKKTTAILFTLVLGLFLCQNGIAQNKMLDGDNQLMAKKTQDLISSTLLSEGGEVLTDGNQRFFVTVNRPVIGVMKELSDNKEVGYWYVSVSGFANNNMDPETKQLSKVDEENMEEIESELLPTEFGLSQNYPNPFNPSTTINFQIPELDRVQDISTTLKIYDIRGRLIRTLLDEKRSPGYYSEFWDGMNDNGDKVSTGIYFYGLKTESYVSSRKMIIIK